jgi:hypothetical protein
MVVQSLSFGTNRRLGINCRNILFIFFQKYTFLEKIYRNVSSPTTLVGGGADLKYLWTDPAAHFVSILYNYITIYRKHTNYHKLNSLHRQQFCFRYLVIPEIGTTYWTVNDDCSSPRLRTGASRSWSCSRPLHFGPMNGWWLRPFSSYLLHELSIDQAFNYLCRGWSNCLIWRLPSASAYKNGVMTPAAQQGFLSHHKPSSKTLPQPRRQLRSRRRRHLLKKSFHRQPLAHFWCRLAPHMNVQPFQSVTATSRAGFGRAHTGGEWHRQVHIWSMVDDFIYVHGSMSAVHRKYSMFYSNRSFHFYYLIMAHI